MPQNGRLKTNRFFLILNRVIFTTSSNGDLVCTVSSSFVKLKPKIPWFKAFEIKYITLSLFESLGFALYKAIKQSSFRLFIVSSAFMLQACNYQKSPSGDIGNQSIISPIATHLDINIPSECSESNHDIYNELKAEKFRNRYTDELIQSMVNLTICLNENGYRHKAEELGFETLLLSQVTSEFPKGLDAVAQIVSDSNNYTYSVRAWADWVVVSQSINNLEELASSTQSIQRMSAEMNSNKLISLGYYFDQLKELEDE